MIYIGSADYRHIGWKDILYPKNINADKWLSHYSRQLNLVEIELPELKKSVKTEISQLADETEQKLKISLKLNKEITHSNINRKNIIENLNIARSISKIYEPLAAEKWLGPLLIEFPYSFGFNTENFEKARLIADCFPCFKRCIEFQHDSWLVPDVIDFLSRGKIALCIRDVPKFQNVIGINNYLLTSDFAYIRFHGRNTENWWQAAHPEDQTDYCYQPRELSMWFNNINLKILYNVNDVYMVFNNCKNCNAVKNSLYLKRKFRVSAAIPSEQMELPFVF